jgi:hypothetical protein
MQHRAQNDVIRKNNNFHDEFSHTWLLGPLCITRAAAELLSGQTDNELPGLKSPESRDDFSIH